MSEHEPTKPTGDEAPQGLGFAKLSMNEIAPAVTEAPATTSNRRTGKVWLVALGVLAVVFGGWFGVRAAFNFPPPSDVQQRFQEGVSALPYTQDASIQGTKFLTGDTLQIAFAPTINTQDADQRAMLRHATTDVLKLLVKALPGKDLTITGLQGETKIVEARYSPTSALTSDKGREELDVALWVKDGEGDGIGQTRENSARRSGD